MRPAGPRTVAEMRDGMKANRQALHRAPQLAPAPLQRLAPQADVPPAPGTLAAMEAERQRLRNARDLRAGGREVVDRVWERAQEHVQREHARVLPLELHDQPSVEAEVALRAARRAGEAYIALSLQTYVTKPAMDEALNRLTETVAAFLTAATSGWPSAAEARAAAQREMEDCYR